jgi:hypothetical protein
MSFPVDNVWTRFLMDNSGSLDSDYLAGEPQRVEDLDISRRRGMRQREERGHALRYGIELKNQVDSLQYE